MKAFCTLLGSEDYVPGLLCLQRSLRKVKSKYPFVVYVTEDISDDARRVLQAEQIVIETIATVEIKQDTYIFERFANTWTKLALWDQTAYETLVYLDADMLLLKNCDELFDLDLKGGLAMAPACTCNPLKKPHYPKSWQAESCFFNGNRAADDFYGNSGLLVFEPQKGLLADILAFINHQGAGAFPFPDQDVLNQFFKGRILPLAYVYNTLKTCLIHHADTCDLDEVKVLHYILEKPWQSAKSNKDYEDLDALWWATYQE